MLGETPTYLILGMHRSGTSLLANWLVQCGFDLNSSKTFQKYNIKGNYEDWSIMKFHNEILARNKMNWMNFNQKKMEITNSDIDLAFKMVQNKQKSLSDPWGWKEPRTCLFVNKIWHKILPNIKGIIIFRHFDQVVDSLMRREYKQRTTLDRSNFIDKIYFKSFLFPYCKDLLGNKWLNVWIKYNEEIFQFCRRNKGNYVICSLDNLLKNDRFFFDLILDRFNCKGLKYIQLSEIFDKNLINICGANISYREKLEDRANRLMSNLMKLEEESFNNYY